MQVCPDCTREAGEKSQTPQEKYGMSISLLIFFKTKNQELAPQTILTSSKTQQRKQSMTVIRTCQAWLTRLQSSSAALFPISSALLHTALICIRRLRSGKGGTAMPRHSLWVTSTWQTWKQLQ